tara:strand:+ start:48 stop:434 length:387 start_codon:yes stop_codon:yes gene_type:complete
VKLHKPLFSIIIIIVHLIFSIISYYDFFGWGLGQPEVGELICRVYLGDYLFLWVVIIGFYEMLTKPSWFKTAIRILLIFIVIGTHIDILFTGVYNTAFISAIVASILILIRFGKYGIKKITERKTNRT